MDQDFEEFTKFDGSWRGSFTTRPVIAPQRGRIMKSILEDLKRGSRMPEPVIKEPVPYGRSGTYMLSSAPARVTKKPVPKAVKDLLLLGESVSRMNMSPKGILSVSGMNMYGNDTEQLCCSFGGSLRKLENYLLGQFFELDASTGMSIYELNGISVDKFIIRPDSYAFDADGHYGDYYYSKAHGYYAKDKDGSSCIPYTLWNISVRGSNNSSFPQDLFGTEASQAIWLLPRIDCPLDELFLKIPSLRALDLSHTDITELPSYFGDAPQLRYLDLSYTSIAELPNSLCNILTLEALILRGCSKLGGLPKALRRLTSLKYLAVDVSCLLVSMPPGVGDLNRLRILPAFVVGKRHGWHITELKNLRYLSQNLSIRRLENVSSPEEAKRAALHEKKSLHKVEFHWSRVEDGLGVFKSLRPNKSIKELQIIGYGGAKFPSWIGDSLFELTTITIHNCSKCTILPTLGRLRSLKFLHISNMDEVKVIDQEFLGERTSSDEDRVKLFPSLEHLTLTGMPELSEWIGVTKDDFPVLQKLNISGCSKLNALPELSFFQSLQQLEICLCSSLRSFPDGGFPISLQSINIIECPKLKERCHKNVGEDWEKLSHIPNILIDYQQISPAEEMPQVALDESEDDSRIQQVTV